MNIEQYLKSYDRVIAFDDSDSSMKAMKDAFLEYLLGRNPEKNCLILGTKIVEDVYEKVYVQLSEEEFENLTDIYRMYDFSRVSETLCK